MAWPCSAQQLRAVTKVVLAHPNALQHSRAASQQPMTMTNITHVNLCSGRESCLLPATGACRGRSSAGDMKHSSRQALLVEG